MLITSVENRDITEEVTSIMQVIGYLELLSTDLNCYHTALHDNYLQPSLLISDHFS